MITKEYILKRVKITEDGHWLWKKSVNKRTGYGQISYWPYTAHKASFILWKGSLEKDEQVRHRCPYRICCNPDCLEKGTAAENWRDSEDIHREILSRRKGLKALNRKRVLFRGIEYVSVSHAMRETGYGWKRIQKEGIFF